MHDLYKESQISDQTVLVTGAAGALGSALATQLAAQGASLLLLDQNSRGLDRVHDEIRDAGHEPPGICPLDLAAAGPGEFAKLTDILESRFGGLNHLLHCAAEFGGLMPLDQVSPADWLRCMQANLNSAWLLTVHCLPLLKRHSRSSIVFTLDKEAGSGKAYRAAYGVSKAATRCLAQIFEQELEATGVRVLAFDPGPMNSALRARAYFAEHPEKQGDPGEAAARMIQQIFSAD